MKKSLIKSEEQIKEVQDISVFTESYIPSICAKIYELYGYNVLNELLSNLAITAEYYQDQEKCLQQIRGYFRMVNSRYPLDLSVYEDTKSGRVLIVTNTLRNMAGFLYKKENEPEIKEDEKLIPLKESKQ